MAAAEEKNNGEMGKTAPTATHVSIKVKNQEGRATYFKIKRDTKLIKLLKSYCGKFFLDYNAINFFLEGQHFNPTKTPNELGLEDEVEIESMTPQIGGGDYEMNSSFMEDSL